MLRFPLVHGIRVARQATLIGLLISIFPYIGEMETGNLSPALGAQAFGRPALISGFRSLRWD